ncbi:hypothetical protein QQX98_004951 [Neonectria punicea]|uniref:Transmembrane protein n=1 Tax=Neonectria punicea TaxID=979145 RepID=A0ABR1H6Z5_9HYPO
MTSANTRPYAATTTNKQKQSWSGIVLEFIKANLELVVFALGWAGLGLSLFLYLHERAYHVGYRKSWKPFWPLHQVEVSFLIAAIDAVTKAVFMAWCSIVAWRTIYILLLTRGTTLKEISSIAYPLPPPFNIFRFSRCRLLSFALVIIISLSLPAQYLSTPLLSGSIAWTPTQFQGEENSLQIPTTGESRAWDEYNEWNEVREGLVLRSASLGLTTSADSFHRNNEAPRRAMDNYTGIPVNSTVKMVKFPYFIVDKVEWIEDPAEQVPEKLIAALKDDNLGLLNISGLGNVITRYTVGNMVVLRDYAWNPAPILSSTPNTASESKYAFPRQEDQNATHELYIAVMVDRLRNVDGENPWKPDCTSSSSMFGRISVNNFIDLRFNRGGFPYAVNCYAIAKVSARAGSFSYSTSRVIHSGIFEAVVSDEEAKELRERPSDYRDLLTSEIFEAMPEVLLNLAITRPVNSTLTQDLERYTCAMLMISFEATWNAMADAFRVNEPRKVVIMYPESRVVMQILWKPFLSWVALVTSASLSGITFTILASRVQSLYGVRIDLRDTVIASMRLDMSDAYGSMPSLCNFTKPSGSEKKVRLRFAMGADFESEEQNHEQHTKWCRMQVVKDMPDHGPNDTELEELVPPTRA